LATVIAQQLPRIATIIRSPIEARGGRVYLDFLQNGAGRLIASPFCVRPLRGAPVSTTLTWDEVVPSLRPSAFTIRNVLRRLGERGDPMAPVLDLRPDLRAVLEALEAKLRPEAPPPASGRGAPAAPPPSAPPPGASPGRKGAAAPPAPPRRARPPRRK
jgi:hypothetical protein